MRWDRRQVEASVQQARAAGFGKLLAEALYLHRRTRSAWPAYLELLVGQAERAAPAVRWDLAKVALREPAVSLLEYPGFDKLAHPALERATRVDLKSGKVKVLTWSDPARRWILHRKEAFLLPSDPHWEAYAALTRAEEQAGLLTHPLPPGVQWQWDERAQRAGYALRGNKLVRR